MRSSIGLVSSCLPSAWIAFTLALTVAALKSFFYWRFLLILVVRRAAQFIVMACLDSNRTVASVVILSTACLDSTW